MTPEEIVASIEAQNRAILASKGIELPGVLDLMNQAGMSGFQLGSATAISRMQSAIVLHMARVGK